MAEVGEGAEGLCGGGKPALAGMGVVYLQGVVRVGSAGVAVVLRHGAREGARYCPEVSVVFLNRELGQVVERARPSLRPRRSGPNRCALIRYICE